MSFRFYPRQPMPWSGRYRRIPGKPSVLHVRWDDVVDLIWQDGQDSYKCVAEMTTDLERLGKLVNSVKRQRTGQPGGSFAITEYGQVVCPVADDSFERFYIGDCTGTITFLGPDGVPLTLDNDSELRSGDDWELPYVGVAYNLSRKDRIYFPQKDGDDTELLYPRKQDRDLIRALRRVRGNGGFRFIVNPHGIVLTKVKEGPYDWQPKYVGRINYDLWFPKDA